MHSLRKDLTEIEIMAPVGSFESLQAAIQGGANSVYFGIDRLNMRSGSSKNFTTDDLQEIVSITQKNNIKTYLTLNTVMYDEDIDLMHKIVDVAAESGISAIIACDMAVLNYARSKNIEIHMSTQANITNIEAVKFYANFADVVVTARELTLDQVAEISRLIVEQNVKGPKGELIRIEMFAHGALCMAISGKCYLSLHAMNKSGNRGECLQVCRRGYKVTDLVNGRELEIDNEYIMSPKDLWTLHFLNKVLDAGVSVLKIEGRARSADYVKTVVQCYKEAVQSVYDDTYTEEKINAWQTKLQTVFNRGFWDGYYLGQKLGEWSHKYGSRATEQKLFTGEVTNYFSKIGVAEVQLRALDLSIGDKLMITGQTTGVVDVAISEIRVDEKPVDHAEKGVFVSFKTDKKVRRGDKVFKVVARESKKETNIEH